MTSPGIVLWRPMYNQRGHAWFEARGAAISVVDTSDDLTRALQSATYRGRRP